MRSSLIVVGGLLFLVVTSGCGGGSSNSPTGPTSASAVTIDILGINGNQSFSPDPGTVNQGQTMDWHNLDTVNAHHIVADDGSFDAGVVPPGATSAVVTLKGAAITYHCSIHPTMVGSINTATVMPPPGGGY